MKNCALSVVLCLVAFSLNTSYASIAIQPVSNGVYALSTEEIRDLSMKEIQARVGHKLNWKEKIGIQLVKHKLWKAEKWRETEGGNNAFWGGFLLGLLLPILAILLAVILSPKNKQFIGGAIVGTLLSVVFFVIAMVALLNALNNR